MQSFRAVYWMSVYDHVRVMTVRATGLDQAQEEVHKRLRSLLGRGVWRYEIYPIMGRLDGQIDTSKP
ncbi:MAG: hypothetical protein AB7L09_21535 [Nitrospira sp.]